MEQLQNTLGLKMKYLVLSLITLLSFSGCEQILVFQKGIKDTVGGGESHLSVPRLDFSNYTPDPNTAGSLLPPLKFEVNLPDSIQSENLRLVYSLDPVTDLTCENGVSYDGSELSFDTSIRFQAMICDSEGNVYPKLVQIFTLSQATPPPVEQSIVPLKPIIQNNSSEISSFNAYKTAFIATINYPNETENKDNYTIRYTTGAGTLTCSSGSTYNHKSNPQQVISISNGTTTVKAISCNKDNVASEIASASYAFDNQGPSGNVVFNPPAQTSGSSITLRLSHTDASTSYIKYKIGATVSSCSDGSLYSSSSPLSVSQSTTVYALACDGLDNKGTLSQAAYVIDPTLITLPEMTTISPAARTFNSSLSISMSVPSGRVVKYAINSTLTTCASGTQYSNPFNITGSNAASNKVKISAMVCSNATAAGSKGVVSEVTYDFDNVKPVLAFVPAGNKTYKADFSVNLSTESGGRIAYTTNGSNPTSCASNASNNVNVTISGSTKTLKAIACDAAGNISNVQSAVYTFDNVAPNLLVSSPTNGSSQTANFVLQGACETGMSVNINIGSKSATANCSNSLFSYSVLIADLVLGNNVISLSQADALANLAQVSHTIVKERAVIIYATQVKPILEKCISCHAGAIKIDNTSEATAFASPSSTAPYFIAGDKFSKGLRRLKFYTHANDAGNPDPTANQNMPAGGVAWTQAETQLLEDWVMGATPNNGGGDTGGGSGTVASCDANLQESVYANTQKLTKSQYTKILMDFFGSNVLSAIQAKLDLLPADAEVWNFDRERNDFSKSAVSPLIEIAFLAAESAYNNSTTRSKIFGTCSTSSSPAANCIDTHISGFAKRIFRRPLTSAEQTSVRALYTGAATRAEGFVNALAYELANPAFLFRWELGSNNSESDANFTLSNYELASRIAFAVTDMGPDDALLAKAALTSSSTSLANDGVLKTEVQRLMGLPSAKTKYRDLAFYWVKTDLKFTTQNMPASYIGSTNVNGFGDAAIDETRKFMEYAIWDGAKPYEDLLTSKASFASHSGLASVYGHSAVSGSTPATFSGKRRGVFGRVPFLFGTSTRTPLIKRGVKFREQVLCKKVDPPTAEVFQERAQFEISDAAGFQLSTREFVATITGDPKQDRPALTGCMTCHAFINPAGNIFEEFDSLGRARSQEAVYNNNNQIVVTKNVDSSANLLLGSDYSGGEMYASSFSDIAVALASGDQAKRCFAKKLVSYTVSQELESTESCRVRDVFEKIKSGEKLSDVIVDAIIDPAMRKKVITN